MNERDQEVIREFLVESYENLSRLDQELVELEKRPRDAALLASVFRTIHTIKGTCGFLGFKALEKVAHQTENLLSQLRDGRKLLNAALASLVLDSVDAIRRNLASIEATGEEAGDGFDSLIERLRESTQTPPGTTDQPVASASANEPAPLQTGPPVTLAEPKPCVEPVDEAAARNSTVSDSNIRVGVGLLDKLMDLVGELVLTRNQILQFNAEREDAALNATSQRLNLITTELQEGVMKTRMQPIGVVWNKLPRVIRDMAVSLGKQICLEMEGAGTELDRTIIEGIKDPLLHIVRNACDHGIEHPDVRVRAGKPPQGKLTLRAYHEGGQVNIEISDDGAGIDIGRVKQRAIERGLLSPEQAAKLADREALNLVFHSGLSTAERVTNVSGRGVGMDVVQANIGKIGGIVELVSQAAAGTTVKLKIPLTLAIIPGLVITSRNRRSAPRVFTDWGERFVIPQVSLVELIRLEGPAGLAQIEFIHGAPVYRRRGTLLPLAYLNEVLNLPVSGDSGVVNIVVLQAEDRQFGLVVDGISDTQEIVVKPLGKQFKGLSIYAGATIMGDGQVALILDVVGIGRRSGVLVEAREQTRAAGPQLASSAAETQRLLLFRTGSFARLAVPLSLVARLEEIPRTSIEHAGGRQVVQYRNRILPLIPLCELLEPETPPRTNFADPAQVIVFNDGNRSVGLEVDQILDVVEDAVKVEQKSGRKGLIGSAVVGKKVADLLDLTFVLRALGDDWLQSTLAAGAGESVLLADGSPFSRNLLRETLRAGGYSVLEAGCVADALRLLEAERVDLIAASLDLPPSGAAGLASAIRNGPAKKAPPVLALAESANRAPNSPVGAGIQDCQCKFDRAAMLESLARLAASIHLSASVPEEAAK